MRLVYSRDKRDQHIFPQSGTLNKYSVELAGLGGDAKYLKIETDWQYNQSLANNAMVRCDTSCVNAQFTIHDYSIFDL